MAKNPLEVKLGSLILKNPVITASGTFGYGEEYESFIDIDKLGGIVTKGITLKPRLGNQPPRIVETPSGILNSIGLQNDGVEAFIQKKLPYLSRLETKVIVNIAGESIKEYIELTERLSGQGGIDAIEINISCPNITGGGMVFGVDKELTYRVVSRVREKTFLPLIVKLTPNVGDIVSIARSAEDAGADIVSLTNTFLGMAIDVERRKPTLGNIFGGLSGPSIKPISLRMVYQVYKEVKIPLIGIGGISSTKDALEFIMAGSSAIQVGTANFFDPTVTLKIIDGLTEFCKTNRIKNIKEIVGVAHL